MTWQTRQNKANYFHPKRAVRKSVTAALSLIQWSCTQFVYTCNVAMSFGLICGKWPIFFSKLAKFGKFWKLTTLNSKLKKKKKKRESLIFRWAIKWVLFQIPKGLPCIWWSPEQFDTWNQLKNDGVLAKEWFLSGGGGGVRGRSWGLFVLFFFFANFDDFISYWDHFYV